MRLAHVPTPLHDPVHHPGHPASGPSGRGWAPTSSGMLKNARMPRCRAILAERLSSADQHLLHDMRQLTDRLDTWGAQSIGSARLMAERLATHPWVAQAWAAAGSSSPVETFEGKAVYQPGQGFDSAERVRAIFDSTQNPDSLPQFISALEDGAPPFQRVAHGGRLTLVVSPACLTMDDVSENVRVPHRRPARAVRNPHVLERLACGRLGLHLLASFFRRQSELCPDESAETDELPVPTPAPARSGHPRPGRMMLTTVKGIPLHEWGKKLPGSKDSPAAHRACSEPLSQWEMAYTPADEEFPKPYLFPILLGVSSGIVLVFVVGWALLSRKRERNPRRPAACDLRQSNLP
jgi:hypothetical protein